MRIYNTQRMRKSLLAALILFCHTVQSQNREEAWMTVNLTNTINQKYTVVTEADERYRFDTKKTRYLHYDVGVQRKLTNKTRIGIHYREIYETRSTEKRVMERRPHIDLFYTSTSKSLKVRTRIEYQFRDPSLTDQWRVRIRPEKWWTKTKLQPFLQEEAFANKTGLVRTRTNAGVTIGRDKKWQLLVGAVLEGNKNSEGEWTWIAGPTLMLKGNQ